MKRSGVYLYMTTNGSGAENPPRAPISNIAVFREFGAVSVDSTYGVADGTSPWDMNDTEGTEPLFRAILRTF